MNNIYLSAKIIESVLDEDIIFSLAIHHVLDKLKEEVTRITGIDINPGASIGSPFFIDHGTGVVIGETSVIGNRVRLYQGVTLGALSPKQGQKIKNVKRHPTIKDDVIIYANTTILGDITIGENTIIGGGVYISEDIPSNSKVSLPKPILNIVKKLGEDKNVN